MARIFDNDCAGSPLGVHRHHFPLRHAPSRGQGTLSRPGEYQRQVCTHLISWIVWFFLPNLAKSANNPHSCLCPKEFVWIIISFKFDDLLITSYQVPKGVCVRQPLLAASPDDQLHSCACQVQVVRVHNPISPGSDNQIGVSCPSSGWTS